MISNEMETGEMRDEKRIEFYFQSVPRACVYYYRRFYCVYQVHTMTHEDELSVVWSGNFLLE